MVAWLLPAAMAASAVLGAGAQIGGGMMANDAREDAANSANQWGLWMQREQQDATAIQAYELRKWQERMSNSAYQRAMTDMRTAGLNPILAYQQGGATSPAGAMGSGGSFSPGSKPEVENFLGSAASSALQAMTAIQGVQSAQETINQTQANTRLLEEEARLRQDQQAMTRANTALSTAQAVTEGHRAGYVSNQAATEAMNPALRAAQTAAASASAAEAGERTVGHRQENERFRNWGPRSSAADAGANLEAAGRRAAATGASPEFRGALDAVGRALGGQSGYSGPRSIPSAPQSRSRWVDDPYGLNQ